MTAQRNHTTARLLDLERTVGALNGQLRDMQWELQQAKPLSLTERLWMNLTGPRPQGAFMSTVCNRRIRPNTKVDHVGTHTGR